MSRILSPARAAPRTMTAADPFSELHREMNRLFDDFLVAGLSSPSSGATISTPRLDVRENSSELCVCADLPGVKPEDLELRMEGNLLTLRGEKRHESEQSQDDYHLMERSYGRFQRSIQLPFTPAPEGVQAEFKDGVLTIHLPKSDQQSRGQRIEIQSPGETGQPAAAAPSDPRANPQPH